MIATDLRIFLRQLEECGELVRVKAEVDPDQEITIIQHRLLEQGGPAVLFENVKGSPYRIVSNMFGTPRRVEMAFGRNPAEIGEELVRLAERMMPPSLSAAWSERRVLERVAKARLRNVGSGPVMDNCINPPRLDLLPCLKCWPLDGGAFFTLPLVHTIDPHSGAGNLGIYRLQRFDASSTGMHWQIEKGGGFHFKKACEAGRKLPVSVILGGPPALTLAAIAPLPEGIDERLLAALIMGCPLDVISRSETGHRIPASAEFVLEGSVSQGDMQQEGPFGDHLGHYSHSAPFPVFRVDRMLARNNAIYPATVVGKPPQEDYYIGEALQDLVIPILRIIRPAVSSLWSYPETGFHPLSVVSVRERYAREGLKHALGLLGEGQLSLTKTMIVVGSGVNVRDFRAVSRALWQYLDPAEGLHLIAPSSQDTLDFTGPSMNMGSKLILLATGGDRPVLRTVPPPQPPPHAEIHPHLLGLRAVGEAFLVAGVSRNADKAGIRAALAKHPVTKQYLFHVLVSDDVPLDDPRLIMWGWFTRFDPLTDLHPAGREVSGNRMVLQFPVAIDATWKEGYRKPVAFDPEIYSRVEKRMDSGELPFPRAGACQKPANDALIKAEENSRMFDSIAGRYDMMNSIMSLGQHGRWRRKAVESVTSGSGKDYLDIGCGTGDVAIELARRAPAASVKGIDLSEKMMAVGRSKIKDAGLERRVSLGAGDAAKLPFADNSFDGILCAFCLRNITDRARALREMQRVLRPGGRVAILELTVPGNQFMRLVHHVYTRNIIPLLGRIFSMGDAYRYLADSIDHFPLPEGIVRELSRAGVSNAGAERLSGGFLSLFTGIKT